MYPTGSYVWRDSVVDGVPASGVNQPAKADIRAWSALIEGLLGNSAVTSLIYTTRTALYANLVPDANSAAIVAGDPTVGRDGLYVKVGATGTGSWSQITDFIPGAQIVTATDAGAGTANAIVATSTIAIGSQNQIIVVDLFETNGPGAVTIQFNGGTVYNLKTASGLDPVDASLPDRIIGTISGTTFTLLSDISSAAIQAVALAASSAAAASATAAAASEVAAAASESAALASTNTFLTTAAGIAATVNGEQFNVLDTGLNFIQRYTNVAGVATIIAGATYPTSAFVTTIDDRFDGLVEIIDTGQNILPLAIDQNNLAIEWFDRSTNKVYGIYGEGTSEGVLPTSLARVSAVAPLATGTLRHILHVGESLSVGAAAGALISTTARNANKTFAGGPRAWTGTVYSWSPIKGLVEDAVAPAPDGGSDRSETMCSGMANHASMLMAMNGTDPATLPALYSTGGRGGSKIADIEKGTSWFNNNTKLHISNGDAADAGYVLSLLVLALGTNDGLAGTARATYSADVLQYRIDLKDEAVALNGQSADVHMLLLQVSSYATSSDMPLATLDVDDADSYSHVVCPTYFVPHADGVHPDNVGYKWLGCYMGRAQEDLRRGYVPQNLRGKYATVRGAEVRLGFDVPQLPLVLDTTSIGLATDYGFRIKDGGVAATISSVVVDGSELVFTLSAPAAGVVTIEAGKAYLGSGLGITNGASTNLRDSTPDTCIVNGVEKSMYHWCLHFNLTAVTIGE